MEDLSLEELAPAPTLAPGWMVTFADLLSLLLALFVILFATSSVDQQQWQERISPISAYLTGIPAQARSVAPSSSAAPAGHDRGYILALLQRTIDTTGDLAGLTTELREGAVWVNFPVQSDARKIEHQLGQLARTLAALDNGVDVLVEPDFTNAVVGAEPRLWAAAMERAKSVAARLSNLEGGGPIGATAGGIGAGQPAGRLSLVILDRSGEDHVPAH